MSKFKKIEFEINTIEPPIDTEFTSTAVCAPSGITGILEKGTLFRYNYDLVIYEERYNILEIKNGMGSLRFSR